MDHDVDRELNREEKAWQVHLRLLDHFGEPDFTPEESAVDELIWTILSANTNDTNSGRAFRQLKATFGDDWDAVRTAPLDQIKDAIRTAGMYNQKAPRIVRTLDAIKADRGEYSIDHLRKMPVDEAEAYLTALPGVGHKTASIVLLFSFGMAAFPVDTHIQRISQRLGISGRSASPEPIKHLWEELLPGETYLALHINLITLGREICAARKPKCDRCPLRDLCDYAKHRNEWAD
jgi:endonuclease-3